MLFYCSTISYARMLLLVWLLLWMLEVLLLPLTVASSVLVVCWQTILLRMCPIRVNLRHRNDGATQE